MKAYLAYCRRMVEFFKPDYLGIGIEVNEIFRRRAEEVEGLCGTASARLQGTQEGPQGLADLRLRHAAPVFQARGKMLEEFQKLMPFNDLVAISYYPFFVSEKERLAALDWAVAQFDSFKKPFAMVETNDLAERLPFPKSKNIVLQGTPANQKVYYEKLLELAQEKQFAFVISFVHQDYDVLWEKSKTTPRNSSLPGVTAGCSTRMGKPVQLTRSGRTISTCRCDNRERHVCTQTNTSSPGSAAQKLDAQARLTYQKNRMPNSFWRSFEHGFGSIVDVRSTRGRSRMGVGNVFGYRNPH